MCIQLTSPYYLLHQCLRIGYQNFFVPNASPTGKGFGAQHYVTAALFTDGFVRFERRWKIKKINRIDELFDIVVKISSLFSIFQYDQVIEILQ